MSMCFQQRPPDTAGHRPTERPLFASSGRELLSCPSSAGPPHHEAPHPFHTPPPPPPPPPPPAPSLQRPPAPSSATTAAIENRLPPPIFLIHQPTDARRPNKGKQTSARHFRYEGAQPEWLAEQFRSRSGPRRRSCLIRAMVHLAWMMGQGEGSTPSVRMRRARAAAGESHRRSSVLRATYGMGASSVFVFYVVPCVVCSLVTWAEGVRGDDDVRDAVRSLREQVAALLERRQEDFNDLEDSLRHSLDKSSELGLVKSQVEELRRDVQKLKGGKKPTLNEQKNDHLTVQWLSTAISELRAELAEMSASYNSSAEMQQRQELASGLDLLRGDVASFRRDLEELRAEQQQTVVTLGQLKQDVETSIKTSQATATATAAAKAQVDEVKTEMSSFSRSMTKLSRDVKLFKTTMSKLSHTDRIDALLDDHSKSVVPENKKYRHNRLLRQQVLGLEKSQRHLQERQTRLDRLVHRLDRHIKANPLGRGSPKDNDLIDERLSERLAKFEEADRTTLKQVFNVSRQVADLGRLHLSVLQLLESVEDLEAKVDKRVPELQREISKMEFGMAQATSSLSLVREDQENQRSSLKALGESVGRLEERLDTEHGHLSSLQAQILNASRWNCGRNETSEGRREEVQDSRLAALEEKLEEHLEDEAELPQTTPVIETLKNVHSVNATSLPELIESLKSVQKEYDNIVHQLPHDCGSIDGRSGIYAIAPGEGPPLLVACDMSSAEGRWTTVQRRIDGSQEFNRKWHEYAVGFGTPSGEFWLGNEALHRLTAGNCSSLRVDFTDIYGKKWVAEYEGFYISDADDGYRIHVGGYSGNASDALEYQNKMQFSAVDSDRDISNTHCAQNYEGGWWFSHCQHANLNGRYNLGLTWFDGSRNEWIAVAFSEMKVRRRRNCGS